MTDEKSPAEDPAASEPEIAPKPAFPPVVALAFVVIALLGVLIVMTFKGNSSGSATDERDLAVLQAETNTLREELNRERIAMGLRPIEGNSEPIEDVAGRLKKDADTLVALAGSYQKLLGEKDSEVSARNAEILRSEKTRQALSAENARLQAELQRALVSGSDSDMLRRELANLSARRDAISGELAAARQKMATMSAGVSEDEHADLKRRFEETLRAKEFFEARVKELEGDLSNAKLFASSENELLPAAVELFRSLQELENHPDSDLTSAYSSIGVKLGANVLKTLTFPTGSAVLSASDEETVRNLAAEIPEGDLMLVIGYASETGNVDGNRVLSSDRATAVARMYSDIKRPGQLAQAVYLGQTDRFSSRIPERNQLCEIWRVRKK